MRSNLPRNLYGQSLVFNPLLPRPIGIVGDAPRPLQDAGPSITEMTVDLASAVPMPVRGAFGFHFAKRGCPANAALSWRVGGRAETVRPGEQIKIPPGSNGEIVRAPGGATSGLATVKVFWRDDVSFFEPDTIIGGSIISWDLLGASPATYINVTENTQPAGLPVTGAFDPAGARKIMLLVDGQAANTLESADLIPWHYEAASGNWTEQGNAAFSLPLPGSGAAYRYRSTVIDLAPMRASDQMYFEIRNLLPAALTLLGFRVVGLE